MKRIIFALLVLVLTVSLVFAGGNKAASSGTRSTLSVLSPAITVVNDVFVEMTDRFAADNPNVRVEYASLGSDYENTMKVRMASNQLPDVFSTHGWAKLRYAEYLMDLKDQSWAKNIDPTMRSLVTIGDKVLTLPMDQFRSGFTYNVGLLQEYGIAVPSTWDEMERAFETIKQKSGGAATGIHIGGMDNWMFGAWINTAATPLTSTVGAGQGDALKNGTYDWNRFMPLPAKLLEYREKGYLNKDYLTSNFQDHVRAFAEGKFAFSMIGPDIIPTARQINPNFRGGVMPIPAMAPGDAPAFQGGEMNSFGVWKDTKNPDVAKKFIEFAAQSEFVIKVCQATSSPSGLTTIKPNLGEMDQFWNRYANSPAVPMWDREFMPNGMWDVMSVAGQELMSGALTPQRFLDHMKSEYLRLRAVAGM